MTIGCQINLYVKVKIEMYSESVKKKKNSDHELGIDRYSHDGCELPLSSITYF